MTGSGGDPDELLFELDVDNDGVIVDCDDEGVAGRDGCSRRCSVKLFMLCTMADAPSLLLPAVDDSSRPARCWRRRLDRGLRDCARCSARRSELSVGVVVVVED